MWILDVRTPWGHLGDKAFLINPFWFLSLTFLRFKLSLSLVTRLIRTREFMPTRGNSCQPVLWPLLEAVALLLNFCPNSVPALLLYLAISPFKVLLMDVWKWWQRVENNLLSGSYPTRQVTQVVRRCVWHSTERTKPGNPMYEVCSYCLIWPCRKVSWSYPTSPNWDLTHSKHCMRPARVTLRVMVSPSGFNEVELY